MPDPGPLAGLLTIRQAATWCEVSRQHVYTLVERGEARPRPGRRPALHLYRVRRPLPGRPGTSTRAQRIGRGPPGPPGACVVSAAGEHAPDEHAGSLAAQAPPLSPRQRDRLAAILVPVLKRVNTRRDAELRKQKAK